MYCFHCVSENSKISPWWTLCCNQRIYAITHFYVGFVHVMYYFAIITSVMLPREDPDKTNRPWLRVGCHKGLISRMSLVTRWEISTTHEWTPMVKNSSSSPKATLIKWSKTTKQLTMFLMLILILLKCLIMLLMHLMFSWKINMKRLLLYTLGHTTRGLRLVCGCPRCLYLTWKNSNKFGYLKTRFDLFL
jgi:hypothetical protein